MLARASTFTSPSVGLRWAPRTTAMRRGVFVRAETGEGTESSGAVATEAAPSTPAVAMPKESPETPATPAAAPGRNLADIKKTDKYRNDMQTAVFSLLLIGTCMVFAGIYFQLQGVKL